MPPRDEMSEVVSRCLPHRQLWVSNLSMVATQWLEVVSNLRHSGYKAQNIPLHHRVPLLNQTQMVFIISNLQLIVQQQERIFRNRCAIKKHLRKNLMVKTSVTVDLIST